MAVSCSVTFLPIPEGTLRGRKCGFADITFDSSYPTGGEAIAAADLKLATAIELLIHAGGDADGNAHQFVHDRTNGKILAYTAGAEVANTTDLSTLTPRFFFLGY
jgi:hypothetical protein